MRRDEPLHIEWKKGLKAEVEWFLGGRRTLAINFISHLQPISSAEKADPALWRRMAACMLGSNCRKRRKDPAWWSRASGSCDSM